jgi:hypothetical protein
MLIVFSFFIKNSVFWILLAEGCAFAKIWTNDYAYFLRMRKPCLQPGLFPEVWIWIYGPRFPQPTFILVIE